MIACGPAVASYVDDQTELSQGISQLRSAIGSHPRVLRVEIDPHAVTIEAQAPNNPKHVNRWRCFDHILRFVPIPWVIGPEPVDLQLLDPDLEANLFDLDSIAFPEFSKLKQAAIKRAGIEDAAVVTHMEIARQIYIVPQLTAGDIRWTLRIASAREHAQVFADAQGVIKGSDLSGTQRAKTLNLIKEPELIGEAAAAFRDNLGTGAILTEVRIDARSMSFATNMQDRGFKKAFNLPAIACFGWDLNGLAQRLGSVQVIGMPEKPPFSINNVDWTICSKLEADALAKVAMPKAQVTRLIVQKLSLGLNDAAAAWTVEVTDPDGEVTSVVADTKGGILRVELPESRRPKIVWLEPATIARAISNVGTFLGPNAKIISIEIDERGGKFTADDPVHGGEPAIFELSADGASRGTDPVAPTVAPKGFTAPRLTFADLASLTEQKFTKLEAAALKKLGEKKKVYLESIRIGADAWFAPAAGAHAITIHVRDVPEDSVQAEYSWVAYDFEDRVVDFTVQ